MEKGWVKATTINGRTVWLNLWRAHSMDRNENADPPYTYVRFTRSHRNGERDPQCRVCPKTRWPFHALLP
jgi:hypothetical protein